MSGPNNPAETRPALSGVCGAPAPDCAPYFTTDDVTLWLGDTRDVLRLLPAGSVDCCVTSPPYFGLRDYGSAGQIGLEGSVDGYVAALVDVFGGVRRALADDGTLWLNLGDSYGGNRGNVTPAPDSLSNHDETDTPGKGKGDTQRKQLLGIPWRVAMALQADGWWLRNAIVWHKPNAMPASVTDRLSNRYEQVFLLAKSERYWFDLDAIREPLAYPEAADGTRVSGGKNKGTQGGVGSTERTRGHNAYGAKFYPDGMTPQSTEPTGQRRTWSTETAEKGKNPGDMWSIATRPNTLAHFATFPIDLPQRCIKAGCKPGGVVLDPFSGSGTTGAAARSLARRYVGIDINSTYHDLAVDRFVQGVLDFGEAS